ncbi:MAG TPA: hypothetical protein VM658_07610 [bacterium]|nr:hypothetical protein [bacterium]
MRRAAGLAAAAVLLCGLRAAAEPAAPFASKLKSWPEIKAELKKGVPAKWEDLRTSVARLKIVRRPKTVLSDYPEDEQLWKAVTGFYDFIRGRELDVSYEQPGIPDFFPDRDTYYDFLDTILPAMRDRSFERNRLLSYQVHSITEPPETPGAAEAVMSITSDDILPFKKVMVFRQSWSVGAKGWYPGKIKADPATYWERIR